MILESIDPGKLTGWVEGYCDNDTPFELRGAWTLDQDHTFSQIDETEINIDFGYDMVVVAERFVLRGGQPFTPDLTGVEIQGVLKHSKLDVHWQLRTEKKKVYDQILKDHGLWHTPKMAAAETGRHINDAIIHALVYLRKIGHAPTIEKYWIGYV